MSLLGKYRKEEEARLAAEKLEKANLEMAANIKKAEALAAENIIAGKSTVEQQVKVEETPEDYANRLRDGKMDANELLFK